MMTYMRSNDAFLGLPHDMFAFTFLQEIIARSVGIDLGIYRHSVGSLHLYDKHRKKARKYLNEAWQSRIEMPPMPLGDPWPNIKRLLSVESRLRRSQNVQPSKQAIPNYWADLARLLQIYASGRSTQALTIIRGQMKSKVFNTYIDKRIAR